MQLDYLRKENHSMEEEFSNAQSNISKLVSDSNVFDLGEPFIRHVEFSGRRTSFYYNKL